jgi:hypothetical protein
MGLTHHWKRPTELSHSGFQAAAADCRKIFTDANELAGFDGSGPPILADDRIVFNGRSPQDSEPFEVALVEFDRHGRQEFFAHCKTLYQSYDLYVKAALIVLSHHLAPNFAVFSDAPDSEWFEARRFVADRVGYGMDFQLAIDPG